MWSLESFAGRALAALATMAIQGCGEERPEPSAPRLALIADDPADVPSSLLSEAERIQFQRGDARFDHAFMDSDGVGPLYIQRACAGCHEGDSRGPGVVERISGREADSSLLDVVRPRVVPPASQPIAPGPGVQTSLRFPPPVFGRGAMEAVSDQTILDYERSQAESGGPIHGRAVHLTEVQDAFFQTTSAPRIGRFGLRSQRTTLESFVAQALVSDMGLTSSVNPNEPTNPENLSDDAKPGIDVSDDVLGVLTGYVRFLALPARPTSNVDGRAIFESLGCAVCHVPSVRTRSDYPSSSFRDRDVELYTDFLLHEMGSGLAADRLDGALEADEWRTAPLIGLRFQRRLLHDGRARTVEEAIAAHDSEGSEAHEVMTRYRALQTADRSALITFVEGL